MNKITESAIEKFTIELLEKQGYEYIYGPTLAPDSDLPERQSFEDVILLEHVKKKQLIESIQRFRVMLWKML